MPTLSDSVLVIGSILVNFLYEVMNNRIVQRLVAGIVKGDTEQLKAFFT